VTERALLTNLLACGRLSNKHRWRVWRVKPSTEGGLKIRKVCLIFVLLALTLNMLTGIALAQELPPEALNKHTPGVEQAERPQTLRNTNHRYWRYPQNLLHQYHQAM